MATNTKLKRRKNRIKMKTPFGAWRIIMSRSNRQLFAQLIEPTGKVVLGAVDVIVVSAGKKLTKVDRAHQFGIWFGDRIKKVKSGTLALDRGGYRYHGRIKAFTEGLRSSGVKI